MNAFRRTLLSFPQFQRRGISSQWTKSLATMPSMEKIVVTSNHQFFSARMNSRRALSTSLPCLTKGGGDSSTIDSNDYKEQEIDETLKGEESEPVEAVEELQIGPHEHPYRWFEELKTLPYGPEAFSALKYWFSCYFA
jgi:hypothetical protein